MQDFPALARIAAYYAGDRGVDWEKRFSAELNRRPSCLLTAGIDGAIAGFARGIRFRPPAVAPNNVVPAGWYLLGLAVAPDRLRGGVGHALTLARPRWMSERANEAWYFTSSANRPSIALHKRLGFREVTRDFTFPGAHFPDTEGILFRTSFRRPGAEINNSR